MYHRVGANVYLLLYYFHARLAAVAASKRIFLMSTPWHGNLGDQAIILAEYQVLKRAFPDYTIIEYPTEVIGSPPCMAMISSPCMAAVTSARSIQKKRRFIVG